MGSSIGCADDRKYEDEDSDDENYDIRKDTGRDTKKVPKSAPKKAATPVKAVRMLESHDEEPPEATPEEQDENAKRIQYAWQAYQIRRSPRGSNTEEAAPEGDKERKTERKTSAVAPSAITVPLLESIHRASADTQEKDDVDDDDDDLPAPSVETFRFNFKMAFRTALACIICSLPVLIPSVYKSIDPAYSSMIGGGVVLMVVFTVCQNFGITVMLAWQGFIGTFMACVPVHVLSAMMPHGAAGDKYVPSIVHAVNVVAIFGGLFLNISKNTRMFYVCYHVYFIMEFMNPDTKSLFNTTWNIDLESYTATTLITSTMGMCVAMFVMLFPTPILAGEACRLQAIESINVLTDIVDDVVSYYAGSESSVRSVRFEVKAVKLRNMIDGMQANLDGAWWESFNTGRQGRSRALLQRHLTMLRKMSDHMYSLQVCVTKEDFGPTHIQLLSLINEEVVGLAVETKKLLRISTMGANDGDIDALEQKYMRESIREVRKKMASLAIEFNKARKEVSPEKRISVELQSESFYAHCLSTYAREAVDYATELLDKPPRAFSSEMPSLCQEMVYNFCALFNPKVIILDANYRSFTLRNTLSVLIAFYGMFWFVGYDGVPAGTVSVLISNFQGSALQKNLKRLQAVTLAQILPHLIAAALGTKCELNRVAMQGFSIMAWEVLLCYVYYSSTAYGYEGCLMAAYVGSLVYPCADPPTPEEAAAAETAFELAAFTKILDTTLAVVCMTIVDLWLARSTAADEAIEGFLCGLVTTDAFFQACLAPRNPKGQVAKGEIVQRTKVQLRDSRLITRVTKAGIARTQSAVLSYISAAEAMSEEANKEPRYYRSPWPYNFFCSLIKSGYIFRSNLIEFEHILIPAGNEYSDPFEQIRDTEEFKTVKKDIVDTMEQCLTVVQTLVKNDTGKSLPKMLAHLDKLEKIDKLEGLPALMDAINDSDATELQYPEEVASTLEEDLLCRLNVAFMVMESTIDRIAFTIKCCIKQLT